jgi:adenylate cyclase
MKVVGKRQSHGNPNLCSACEDNLIKHHGGAEVAGSILFADIRGSTRMAEAISPTKFRELLNRFYTAASQAVFANSGVVDKFVGDEIMAVFPPMLGEDHPARAVAAAQGILRATGHDDPAGPWAPVGAGVHTGQVWFGAVGEGQGVEITVVGDTVNTAARLAAAAGPGEIVVSTDVAAAAGLDPDLPRRSLELKGKTAATDVVTVRVEPS